MLILLTFKYGSPNLRPEMFRELLLNDNEIVCKVIFDLLKATRSPQSKIANLLPPTVKEVKSLGHI